MKKCANCGFENPDDVNNCQSCSTETFVASSTVTTGGHIISPEENRVWERMTFRQFIILFIRVQAIWLLVYAVDEATYLPRYFAVLHNAMSDSAFAHARNDLFWAFFRVIWHIAATIAVIRYAERIASWLIRDTIPREPLKSGDIQSIASG